MAYQWVSYFDDSYWGADWGSWDDSNQEWDAENPFASYFIISISRIGTWASGFRPTHVRVTYTSGQTIGCMLLDDTIDPEPQLIALNESYTSGTSMAITWGSEDLMFLQALVYPGNAFSITNIEFYADVSSQYDETASDSFSLQDTATVSGGAEIATDSFTLQDSAVVGGTQTFAKTADDSFTLNDGATTTLIIPTTADDSFTLQEDTVVEQTGYSTVWGEQNPPGEYGTPQEWSVWKKSIDAVPQTISGSDWGYLNTYNQTHVSNVYDTTKSGTWDFTLSTDDWQVGSGAGTISIRGDASSFLWDDGSPDWGVITTTVTNKEWRYIQLKVEHSV